MESGGDDQAEGANGSESCRGRNLRHRDCFASLLRNCAVSWSVCVPARTPKALECGSLLVLPSTCSGRELVERSEAEGGSDGSAPLTTGFERHFRRAVEELGIAQFFNYPRHPQANAHVERFQRTLRDQFLNPAFVASATKAELGIRPGGLPSATLSTPASPAPTSPICAGPLQTIDPPARAVYPGSEVRER